MKKNLSYKCENCDTPLFSTGHCKNHLVECHICGSTHFVNFDGKELKVIMRLPEIRAAPVAEQLTFKGA